MNSENIPFPSREKEKYPNMEIDILKMVFGEEILSRIGNVSEKVFTSRNDFFNKSDDVIDSDIKKIGEISFYPDSPLISKLIYLASTPSFSDFNQIVFYLSFNIYLFGLFDIAALSYFCHYCFFWKIIAFFCRKSNEVL